GGRRPDQYNVLFLGNPDNAKLTAPAAEAVNVQVGQPAQVEFRAIEGRLLTGKVVEADTGKPLAKCHVGYYGPARPRSGAACIMVRTDEQGAFQFHIPPGVTYIYVAEGGRRSLPDSTRTIEVSQDTDPPPLLLKAAPIVVDSGITTQVVCVTPEQAKKLSADQSYVLQAKFRTTDGRPVTKVEMRLVYEGNR